MKSLRSSALSYGIGYVVFTACRLAQVVVAARMLGPSLFGLWSALSLFRQYGQLSDLGMSKGVGRLLPKLLHDGHQRRAELVLGLGWMVGMLATLLFAAVLTGYALLNHDSQTPFFVAGWTTLLLLLFLDKHYACLVSVFQSSGRVGEAGIWMGVMGCFELLLGITLTAWFGLPGFYASLVLSMLLVDWGMQRRSTVRLSFRLNRKLLTKLGTASLLLTGFSLLNIALHNVDRVAIALVFGGGPELSNYHIASLVAALVTQVPTILMSVLTPQIYRHGAGDVTELRRYTLLPTSVVASTSVMAAVFSWVGLPFVFECLLPEYRAVVPLARILVVGEIFFANTMVMENINVVMGRAHLTLTIRWVCVAASFVSAWWLLRQGSGSTSVALVMCTAHITAWLAVSWLVTGALGLSFVRYTKLIFAPLIFGAVVVAASLAVSHETTLSSSIFSLIVCLVGMCPLLMTGLANAELGIIERVAFSRNVLRWWRSKGMHKSAFFGGLAPCEYQVTG